MWLDPKDIVKDKEDIREFYCSIIRAKVTLTYCNSHGRGTGCNELESCRKLGVFENAL